MRRACALLAAGATATVFAAPLQPMQPLSDAALSSVRGGDGVSFDLSGFSMNGDVRITYTPQAGRSAWIGNLSAARSDNAVPFADPYRLDIGNGPGGLADIVSFAFPANQDGEQRWQFAYDWGVDADGIVRDGGSVVLTDVVYRGGGLQFSTPRLEDGVAFGLGLDMHVGELAWRANGRAATTGQLALQGLRLGAVDADGNFTGKPWAIADVAAQPAVVNALADESGAHLHVGIGWPDSEHGGGSAATGGLQIDKVTFTNPGGTTTDLGSSRIGSIQIQYLDVKFRP
ncbi:hypothetical protein [Pseudoduganella chitinolytica]|uniref:Uncharacterized protein n=1 Tax=Pseudoduganella chitinolytica TaxID=34070 RepID=A0ABY8B5F2_9BURK|nr:hypothetical protein [Pseudoduganella chitinolytica]WEF30668.1 hypothetical protein PX653_14395 [Pseudoduganella chitinolytica]